jgi:3-isopropylmalate dehydrogenase
MKLEITVLPGDGIGPEVTQQAVRILQSFNDIAGYDFRFTEHKIGGAAILEYGSPLPRVTLDACLQSDAVLLGAVGSPTFDSLAADARPEAGLLQLRVALGGFANLRPARARKQLLDCSPFRREIIRDADVLIVRELLGGVYFGEPRADQGTKAFNTMSYSEQQVQRVAHIAFQQARNRHKKVTSVDKANVLETSQLWRRTVNSVSLEYPEVKLEHMYVDACAMQLAMSPSRFDVLLTENLFGDILSDQAASICGSLGLLPSATIGGSVDLYEPVHGSAPDIVGTGKANPIGAIESAAMLLRHTARLESAAQMIEDSIDRALDQGLRTPDLARSSGTVVSTSAMAGAIEQALADALQLRHAYHAV